MTVLRFVLPGAFRKPSDAAEYFRFGADYLVDVAEGMGWDHGGADAVAESAYAAMREGRTDVPDDEATLIGAVLVGDAEFWWPMGEWLPPGYALLMRGLSHALRRKLLRLAGVYTDTLEGGLREFYHAHPSVREGFGAPEFTTPGDEAARVEGEPATAYVPGLGLDAFARRTVLGDSVLHVEWYAYVAERVGVDYDEALCDRAVAESPAYFAGVADDLSDDVRELQRVMFSDSDWIRDFHDHYRLRSVLFRRAAEGIEGTAERLGGV